MRAARSVSSDFSVRRGHGIRRPEPGGHASSANGRAGGRGTIRLRSQQPRAKRVIWLMMRGGVSHLESFDPKPELNKHAGKTIAESAHKAILDSPLSQERARAGREQHHRQAEGQDLSAPDRLQTGRTKRHPGQRLVAASAQVCRRHRRHSLDVHDRQQPRRPDGVSDRPPSARWLPSDDRLLDPLRAGIAERRLAAIHLDGARAGIAVFRGRRFRLPGARACRRVAQGGSQEPTALRPTGTPRIDRRGDGQGRRLEPAQSPGCGRVPG